MTPERFRRIVRVLDRRQPDLTVLMDNVHKPHNLSAVLRTADAVGVVEVHARFGEDVRRPGRGPSRGAHRWVAVVRHRSLSEAGSHLHDRGFSIVAADPGHSSADYRDFDYTRPVALLLGQERDGVSEEGRSLADATISIPMHGFSASLNVSVAAALILFEAARQREAAGMYEVSRLGPERRRALLFEWAHPDVATLCRARGMDYPRLNDEGEIVDPLPFAAGSADA